ncbi:MAG TPA: class I SAM-dependent methyltransferase [Ktedonobacteraceae bacterium]
MQETDDVFRLGKYHRSFQKKHIHFIRSVQLRIFYTTSVRLVKFLGWPDPLAGKAPRVLLCGTASPYTTCAFARFVGKRQSTAAIDVLDISPYVLSQSAHFLRSRRDIDASRISFVTGDALHLPFADECFDWIETDFFLQFFSAQEKAVLFQEWYRVLKAGGVVTTRDWLITGQGLLERVITRTKNWLVRHVLGPIAYTVSAQDVLEALAKPGFTAAVFPVRIPGLRLKLPAMQYLLIQKPSEREQVPS